MKRREFHTFAGKNGTFSSSNVPIRNGQRALPKSFPPDNYFFGKTLTNFGPEPLVSIMQGKTKIYSKGK